MRRDFEMTQEDLDGLLEAMKPVPYMVISGTVPMSQQENANAAWQRLGDKMGFDGITVRPNGKGDRHFSAVPKEFSPMNITDDQLKAMRAGCDDGNSEYAKITTAWLFSMCDELLARRELDAKLAEPEADNARLREALRPFVKDELMAGLDDGPDEQMTSWPSFCLGDFRRAHAALEDRT